MKLKDIPEENHYAIIEYAPVTNYSDNHYASTIDVVNYQSYKSMAELEEAVTLRYRLGETKPFRVISVAPMEITVKAVANLKPVMRGGGSGGPGTII